MQKSHKLLAEEAAGQARSTDFPIFERDQVIKIKPITCYNDWVIVLPFSLETKLALPANVSLTNQGMVVGIGCGLPDNAGKRIESPLSIGDTVLFQDRSIAMRIAPTSGVYAGKQLAVLSERNIVCKLDYVKPYVIEDDGSSLV